MSIRIIAVFNSFNHHTPMLLSLKPLMDRKIQPLFPIVLYSILILAVARLVLDNLRIKQGHVFQLYDMSSGGKNRLPVVVSPEDRIAEECNVFEGTWVWDNVSHPLYEEESCPYLVKQTTCKKNGRPESFYKNWKWQPHGCNLPRFDPSKLLHVLRNKRIMFIGDSLQRGQFESMICLVQSVIPEGKKSLKRIPPRKIFKSEVHQNVPLMF